MQTKRNSLVLFIIHMKPILALFARSFITFDVKFHSQYFKQNNKDNNTFYKYKIILLYSKIIQI